MRIALLAVTLVTSAAGAQPSPALQLGTTALARPCSANFPDLQSQIISEVSSFKQRSRQMLPDAAWTLVEENLANNRAIAPNRAECEELVLALQARHIDKALELVREDAVLEERAAQIRAATPNVLILGVRFRFDTLHAVVEQVRENSLAAQAGVLPGDVVVEINGEPIARSSQARLAILRVRSGEAFPIVVERGGQRVRFTLAPQAGR